MCTRYYVEMSPELRPYIEAAEKSPLKDRMVRALGKPFRGEGEIRPTDMTTVIAPGRSGTRSVFPMVWGYHIPGLDRPVVNARSETAPEKRSFAEDWEHHRCIIPASWYFEWEHLRQPDGRILRGDKYAIQPRGSGCVYLAGLYRIEKERGLSYPVFTILTGNPGPELLRIHDRMPLVLPASAIDDWISPGSNPAEIAALALTDMVFDRAGN